MAVPSDFCLGCRKTTPRCTIILGETTPHPRRSLFQWLNCLATSSSAASPCPRDKNDKKGGNIEREREGRSFFFKSSIHLILLFELKLKLKLDNESIEVLHVEGKKKRKGRRRREKFHYDRWNRSRCWHTVNCVPMMSISYDLTIYNRCIRRQITTRRSSQIQIIVGFTTATWAKRVHLI